MCGILAWWNPPANASFVAFENALKLQSHRGPDDEQAIALPDLWLGHNRLAILDLSPRGRQPMVDRSGRYTIIYNGEVYNYIELREELRRGNPTLTFTTGTDTEVVLAAFAAWGAAAFDRFNGMWALVIWDAVKQRLTASRDRFGIKPLYLMRSDGGMMLSSEIKPLLALADRAPSPNIAQIAGFFATGNIDGNAETWFSGIERFAQGATLTVSRAEGESWVKPRSLCAATYSELIEREDELDGLLSDAVAISMRSDVPVGVCLSGGIDSSTIACLASERQHIESFTCRHHEASSDEFRWVEALAERRPIGLNPIYPDPTTLEDDLSRILWHLEEPAKATGVLSQWCVMRHARDRQIKVLLDGQGGDEVFGGYDFHRWPFLKGLLLRREMARAYTEAKIWGWGRSARAARNAAFESLKRPARRALQPLRGRSYADKLPWTDEFLSNHLLPTLETAARPAALGGLHERLSWDVGYEMLPALLRYEDKLSMAFSIESRVPLLDRRVVDFAFSLPPRDLIRDGWSKWPLRRLLDRRGASAVAWRRDKQGFPTPMNMYWRAAEPKVLGWLTKGRLADAGIVSSKRVEAIVRQDLTLPHSRLTWHLVQSEWWFRNFIDGDYTRNQPWT